MVHNLWTIIHSTEIDKRSVEHLGTPESGLQIIDDEPMDPNELKTQFI